MRIRKKKTLFTSDIAIKAKEKSRPQTILNDRQEKLCEWVTLGETTSRRPLVRVVDVYYVKNNQNWENMLQGREKINFFTMMIFQPFNF